MKKFENPELEIQSLDVTDVITVSGGEGCRRETELGSCELDGLS